MTRRTGEQGFTLVELLVVLVIAGLLLAIVPPAAGRGSDRVRLRGAAQELAGSIALARSQAILTNADAAFALDLSSRRFGLAGQALEGRLDADLRIDLVTAASSVSGGAQGQIRFHPNGGSAGGELRIANRAGAMVVRVDWMTGRTRILRDPA